MTAKELYNFLGKAIVEGMPPDAPVYGEVILYGNSPWSENVTVIAVRADEHCKLDRIVFRTIDPT